MSFRSSATLAAMLCTAPFGLLAAQQSSAPITEAVPMGAAAPEQTAPAFAPAAAIAQPHASPLFQKESAAAVGTSDPMAASSGGDSHVFRLSTLAIVLIAVLLAVLIF